VRLLDTWYLHENGTHVVMKGIPRLIREYAPDVIHCVMEPWSLTCLQVLSALAFRGGPRPRFGLQAAETLPGQGSAAARFLRLALYRRVMARTDYFIGWSTRAVEVARAMGLNGTPSASAPALAVDTDLFRPLRGPERDADRARRGWSQDEIVVGFVGRFEPEKGVEDLLQAMDLAVPLEPRLRLVLLGSGTLGARLEQAASLRPWMTVLPPLDAAGVARHMAALDLLAMPSRTTSTWDEQFGLVAVEAMACGTAVIAADSGSLPETVGDAGVLVPERDPGALSRSIVALAESGADRSELHRKGLQRVETRFAPAPLAHLLAHVMVRG
jgi:glycosyltransferase involved in cell wall biosynthesis